MTLKKGTVIDSISVNDSLAESFSLYLPTNFVPEQRWPVVFVFDDSGRGRTSTQLFRHVAEEQGYVIVSSNDIKKEGDLIENVKVATRLINRVVNLIPIDENGVYTAGFAEGAVVANVLPTVFPNVAGVLAIGDAWVNQDFQKKGANFTFLGLVGYEDHRYYLLQEMVQMYTRVGQKAEIYYYPGGREWPNNDIISNAVGFFTLQAMQEKRRPEDLALIDQIYNAELETAERYRRTLHFYHAQQLLEQMESRYRPFGKRDDIRQRNRELRRSRQFKTQRRQYNRAAAKEAELREQYIYFFSEDVVSIHFENLGWWNQQITELQQMQQGSNKAEAEMAHRLHSLLKNFATSTYKELQSKNARIDALVFASILQTIFDKNNPEGYLNIISLTGQDGDYYTALLYLEDLLKTGFSDLDALYDFPGAIDLKLSPEYNELIKQYLGESKYYNIEN